MSDKEKASASGSINRRDLLKAAVVAPTAALVQLAPAVAAASPARVRPREADRIRAEGF